MLLLKVIGITLGIVSGLIIGVLTWWKRTTRIDTGSVSDGWRAEQRGKKALES